MKYEQELEKLRGAPTRLIVVEQGAFQLTLKKRKPEDREWTFRKVYRIAVGTPEYPTPMGDFIINTKAKDPAWRRPDSEWVQPPELRGTLVPGGDPSNPIVSRWLGVTPPGGGIGIHGTNKPWSIGTRDSHGCIRMHPADVEDLFDQVPIGTLVQIR